MIGALSQKARTPTRPRTAQTKPDLRRAVARGPCAPSPTSEKDEERDSEDDDQRDEDHALAIVRPEFPDGTAFVLDRLEVRKEDGGKRGSCSPSPQD